MTALRRLFYPTLVALAACTGDDPADEVVDPPGVWPFPRADMVVDGAVVVDDLPFAATPWDAARLARRSGFSVVQPSVFQLGDVDPASLPGYAGGPPSVRLLDLTDGVDLPCFVELDAYPELDGEDPTVIVRPLAPAPHGHEVAVVFTTEVLDTAGAPLERPAWFDAIARGNAPAGMDAADAQRVLGRLGELGIDAATVALATWYPVDDPTGPVRHVAATAEVPAAWTLTPTPEPPPQAWRQAQGTFTAPRWLDATGHLVFDDAGLPVAQGELEATLFIHVSQAAYAAGPGQAPVWIFGHGIFSNPAAYLTDPADADGVLALAEQAGAIVVGTTWRGLTTADLGVPFGVGADIATIPTLTDHLVQGVSDVSALMRLVLDGDLLDDPVFEGRASDVVRYYGISLGAIEGAATLALNPRISHGVLHVGGSSWATMLERSKNWTTFESFVLDGLPSASDRQLAYAATQLFWDSVDPAQLATELTDRSLLWQVALGDDQVPNLTSWALLRGVGATAITPATGLPGDLPTAAGPITGPAVAVFDPELGNHEAVNRPAPSTLSHNVPRTWQSQRDQTLRFLDPVDPGVVIHPCGDAPCTPDNATP